MQLRRRRWSMGMTRSDYVFMTVVHAVVFLFFISCAYPLYFMIIASFSDPDMVNMGRVLLAPRGLSLRGYQIIFENGDIWMGYRNTIFYSVANTALYILQLFMMGYTLSYSDIPGKGFFIGLMMIPMFFSGGLIPTYLLLKSMGFVNSPLIMIIPGGVGLGNVAIVRTYMRTSVPWELREAAHIDGCSIQRCFTAIIMPLCKPIIAVMALWTLVGNWNAYTTALIYLTDRRLFPLQLILREILIQNDTTQLMKFADDEFARQVYQERLKTVQMIKYAVIIVSTLPMLLIYPYLQKYFVKGVMIGSLKG